jgi:hypothetical protein
MGQEVLAIPHFDGTVLSRNSCVVQVYIDHVSSSDPDRVAFFDPKSLKNPIVENHMPLAHDFPSFHKAHTKLPHARGPHSTVSE